MRGLLVVLVLAAAPVQAQPGDRSIVASWYGARWDGRTTASGERFDHRLLTAAHRRYPLGTTLLVTRGELQVLVRINDRGPHNSSRGLDLSEAAAQQLDMISSGVARVQYRVVNH